MKPGIVKYVKKEVAELKKNMAAWDIHINEEKTNLLVEYWKGTEERRYQTWTWKDESDQRQQEY